MKASSALATLLKSKITKVDTTKTTISYVPLAVKTPTARTNSYFFILKPITPQLQPSLSLHTYEDCHRVLPTITKHPSCLEINYIKSTIACDCSVLLKLQKENFSPIYWLIVHISRYSIFNLRKNAEPKKRKPLTFSPMEQPLNITFSAFERKNEGSALFPYASGSSNEPEQERISNHFASEPDVDSQRPIKRGNNPSPSNYSKKICLLVVTRRASASLSSNKILLVGESGGSDWILGTNRRIGVFWFDPCWSRRATWPSACTIGPGILLAAPHFSSR
ncbi:unnamed protein product [Lepeophtheirus salmonis]|uniref:(salmon louse) hypothetical protein n=1 Tax=Lepeophtheirus salmonis TaxID=72036 RepID=A0A7R8CNX5_LEPSM|nr:unnamed protein product [Lepeophtheirus salmonis]CAF2880461.1 unnamed protein product [Lepeophtheirus salmonis]